MPCPVRMRGPECLGRDGACVRYVEEVRGHDEPGSKVAESTTCQAADSGTGKCKTAMCNVWIEGKDYCSECAEANDHIIDGKCTNTDSSNICTKDASKGLCTSCANGYFLHKGGCYQFGGEVGKLICTDPSTSDGSPAAGACTTCAPGYFKSPADVAAGTPPCIACNDTKGVTVSDATYKGVANCAACTAPEKGTSSGDKPATCTACVDGYFTNTDGTTCAECTSPCKTCKGANNKCTSCNEGNTPYFKEGGANDGTGTCVAEGGCGNTHFPVAADKKCYPCTTADKGGVDGCTTCALRDSPEGTILVTCSACTTDTKKPNKAGTKCFECQMDGCSACRADNMCEACDGKKVSPGGSSCVPNCPENSSDQNGACICSSGFAPSGDTCVRTGGNLSTGAIAGISVAVIVVVGGLVGFLCWWFLCRGKA